MAYSPGSNTYVQNTSGVWTPVGWAAGNAQLPAQLFSNGSPIGSDLVAGPELYATDPDAAVRGSITAASGVAALTAPSSGVPLATSAAAIPAAAVVLNGLNRDGVTVVQTSGTWSGTLVFEASVDGTNFFPLAGSAPGYTTAPVYSTTVNGVWRFNTGGYAALRCRSTAATWTGSASIILNGSAVSPMVTLAEPTVGLVGSASGAYVTPFGSLYIAGDGAVVFGDMFDGATVDTTTRWATTGSTVLPTLSSSGNLTVNPGTAASAASVLTSQPTFNVQTISDLVVEVQLEASRATGNHRFWGLATVPGSWTAATPLYDAIGVETTTAGVTRAVVYNAGTVIASLALPNDGLNHPYFIQVKPGLTSVSVDTPGNLFGVMVGATSGQNLPVRFHSINGASATTGTPTMVLSGHGVFDSTNAASQIADGAYPWRKASLSPVGTRTALDVNLAGSAGGTVATSGVLSGTTAPTSPNTVSTSSAVVAAVGMAGNATITINGGSYTSLVVVFEASDDNGVTYYPIAVSREDASAPPLTVENVTATISRMYTVGLPGITHLRVRANVLLGGGGPTVRITPGPFLVEPNPTVTVGTTLWGVAGRTSVAISANAPSGALAGTAGAETLLPLAYTKTLGTPSTAATYYPIANARTLRVTQMSFAARMVGTLTATGMHVSVRASPTGAIVTTASPVLWAAQLYCPATANAVDRVSVTFPDGFELAAGATLAVSYNQTAASNLALDASITGFEY